MRLARVRMEQLTVFGRRRALRRVGSEMIAGVGVVVDRRERVGSQAPRVEVVVLLRTGPGEMVVRPGVAALTQVHESARFVLHGFGTCAALATPEGASQFRVIQRGERRWFPRLSGQGGPTNVSLVHTRVYHSAHHVIIIIHPTEYQCATERRRVDGRRRFYVVYR